MKQKSFSRRGFTLTEFLIVIAILAFMALMLYLLWSNQQGRARDARRKADLDKIKIVFEDYYNDNNCYPPADTLDNCWGPQLQPYLDQVPCDPFTQQSYVYLPEEGNACKGYRLLTNLEDNQDPAITEAGCQNACGCGYGDEYTYGVSSGVSLVADSCTPLPPAEVEPDGNPDEPPDDEPGDPEVPVDPNPDPGTHYACAPGGICNVYADTGAAGCPRTFINSNCENACSNPANWCAE